MIGRQPALAPLPMGTVRSSDFGANIDDSPEDWYALLLTYAEFAQDAADGCLTDDDGFGEYATEIAVWDGGPAVHPSDLDPDAPHFGLHESFTHILWFNR